MTIASVIFTYNQKIGGLLIVLSLLVGISRVLAHVHHGIDIVGSVVIALMTTYLSYRYAVERFTYKLPYVESQESFRDERSPSR